MAAGAVRRTACISTLCGLRAGAGRGAKSLRGAASAAGPSDILAFAQHGADLPRGAPRQLIDKEHMRLAQRVTAVVRSKIHGGAQRMARSDANKLRVRALEHLLRLPCLASVRDMHRDLVDSGGRVPRAVVHNLLDYYAKRGTLEEVLQLVRDMKKQDVQPEARDMVNLVLAYAGHGHVEKACTLLDDLLESGSPGVAELRGALPMLADRLLQNAPTEEEWLRIRDRYVPGVPLRYGAWASRAQLVPKAGRVAAIEEWARTEADTLGVPGHDALMDTLRELGEFAKLVAVYQGMRQRDMVPDTRTYLILLRAAAAEVSTAVLDGANPEKYLKVLKAAYTERCRQRSPLPPNKADVDLTVAAFRQARRPEEAQAIQDKADAEHAEHRKTREWQPKRGKRRGPLRLKGRPVAIRVTVERGPKKTKELLLKCRLVPRRSRRRRAAASDKADPKKGAGKTKRRKLPSLTIVGRTDGVDKPKATYAALNHRARERYGRFFVRSSATKKRARWALFLVKKCRARNGKQALFAFVVAGSHKPKKPKRKAEPPKKTAWQEGIDPMKGAPRWNPKEGAPTRMARKQLRKAEE
eukprot:TRINITY_DN52_c0_g1_i2.p2 TRINITY_DN52_c0_g1~~TRINITY_DN52_c0_g1_i2.p2  ORF type:complete len:614 (+),score=163.55 TRINITY_DN52_c0_g1_i2:95-1843(+)